MSADAEWFAELQQVAIEAMIARDASRQDEIERCADCLGALAPLDEPIPYRLTELDVA